MAETTAEEVLGQARSAIAAGDQDAALTALRRLLGYPHGDVPMTDDVWRSGIAALRDFVALHPDLDRLLQVIDMALPDSRDLSVLYSLGYELIEVGLNRIAATALIRANRIGPGHEKIITELCTALEHIGLHSEAVSFLEEARAIGVDGMFPTYLLGFNAFLAGDANRTREALAQLDVGEDESLAVLPRRLEGFVERHQRIAAVSALDSDDLRGWTYAVSGSLVTHVSPHGFEVMRGRYAMVQDSEAAIHEGIQRLALVLEAWQFAPAAVCFTPDRSSEILGHAIAQHLGRPLQPFGLDPSPGKLIVTYDFSEVDQNILQSLLQRGPNEVLFTHAMPWVNDYPLSADVCTFHHQYNIAPWAAGRMRIDSETNEVHSSEANGAPSPALASEILSASPEEIEATDRAALQALAQRVGLPQPGLRLPHYAGSPVVSSKFA